MPFGRVFRPSLCLYYPALTMIEIGGRWQRDGKEKPPAPDAGRGGRQTESPRSDDGGQLESGHDLIQPAE